MSTWPLIQRNKVEDSKVSVPVQACTKSEDEPLAELAKKVCQSLRLNDTDLRWREQLLAQWDMLEYAYRIPKRLKGVSPFHFRATNSQSVYSRRATRTKHRHQSQPCPTYPSTPVP